MNVRQVTTAKYAVDLTYTLPEGGHGTMTLHVSAMGPAEAARDAVAKASETVTWAQARVVKVERVGDFIRGEWPTVVHHRSFTKAEL